MTNEELAELIVLRYRESHLNEKNWKERLLTEKRRIVSLFKWDATPEGWKFWNDLNKILPPVNIFLKTCLGPGKFINLKFYVND